MVKTQWLVMWSLLIAVGFLALRRYVQPQLQGRGAGQKRIKKKKSRKGRTPSPEPEYSPNLPDLIMLLGIPGSGKSTWAKQYVHKCDASFTIVSADEIRKEVTGNMSDQSRNEEIWEIVLNHVQGLLRNGRNVILDATNTGTEKRRKFCAKLPPANRFMKIFQVTKGIAKSRIARDLDAGVDRAPVPDHVIERMNKQFHDAVMAVKDERWTMK